jgi:dTDP-4-dehydrorhamnose reductase
LQPATANTVAALFNKDCSVAAYICRMKVLVTGANGLLGQHLVPYLLRHNYAVIATGRGPSRVPFSEEANYRYYDADISNEAMVHEIFLKERPEIVVHGAAMTQVDACEQQQDACFEINVQATAQLLVMAEQMSNLFIYLSTDFVFDGEQGYYTEDDQLNPISWYGFTKVQAESTVETSEIPWAIVRTCLVYGNTLGGTRSNIIGWVKKSLEEGKAIQVVDDQVRTPTYVEDLAKGIERIIHKRATGIYHIAGKDVLTPYEMAMATATHLQLDVGLIKKVNASIFSQPAKRPPKTGFNISKAQQELGYEPMAFAEALGKCF